MKGLSFLHLTLITIASVASVRNLAAAAFFGPTLIFFFSFGALFFLLPAALVSAELSATFPDKGGLFFWVQRAFGFPWSFFSVWFQWIANVVWCPLSLSFFAGTLLYLLGPEYAENKFLLIVTSLSTYWLMTIVNLFGIQFSVKLSALLSLLGIVVPIGLLLFFGMEQLPTPAITVTKTNWLPGWEFGLLVPLSTVMLGFCGIEVATIHILHVRDPKCIFPRALLTAAFAITFIFILGSLSIARAVPHDDLSMISGLMQAFSYYMKDYQGYLLLPSLSFLIALGTFSGTNTWVLAIARGLFVSARNDNLPSLLARENRFGAPYVILILQGIVVSLFSLIFLLVELTNSAFWILTTISSQLYMMMYLLLFASAIAIRWREPSLMSPFRIPGKKWRLTWIALAGFVASLMTIVIGFIPPHEIALANELWLIVGMILCCLPPLLRMRKRRKIDLNIARDGF